VGSRKKLAETHGRVRAALETTITELEAAGRLAAVDQARVEIARTLADTLDAEPLSAQLWREYRAAERHLREENDAQRDPFDDLLAHLQAQVRDEEKPTKPKPRARSSGNR
jgi:phosphoglycerate-specific signal transduction histidine kinase